MTPAQFWFEFSYGALLVWLAARQKRDNDEVTEKYRIARIHAYRLVGSFAGKGMPTPVSWWPMPGDVAIKQMPVKTDDVLKGADFVRAFGAAFAAN